MHVGQFKRPWSLNSASNIHDPESVSQFLNISNVLISRTKPPKQNDLKVFGLLLLFGDRILKYLIATRKTLSGHILVSWDVEDRYANSALKFTLRSEYVLDGNCQKVQNSDAKTIPLDKQVRSYELKDARPWASMAVIVSAEDSSLGKTDHIYKIFSTHETSPTEPPQNVRIVYIQANSAQVTWDPPPCKGRGGALVNYDIEISPRNAQDQRGAWILQTQRDDVSITALKSFSQYQARVRFVNANGEGPWSKPLAFNTSQSAPGYPRVLYNFTYDDISIGLFIGYPPDSKGRIDQYEIELRGSPQGLSQLYTPVNGTEYVIGNLQPNTFYEIKVRAQNSAGWGAWSRTLSVMTKEEIKPIPLALRQTGANTTCIQFHWAPPTKHVDLVFRYK
ncbi:receptor-type tyrosine-protein phosphatase kappa, partial [Plakobranchus ocellatus]